MGDAKLGPGRAPVGDDPVPLLPAQRRQWRELGAVRIEDGGATLRQERGEQPLLGGAVGCHVAMVVEVVAGQIGECRRADRDAIEAELRQTMT